MSVLEEIVSDQIRSDLPELASGDTVRVSAKVVEGNRERIQVFEGTIMRLRGGGITRSITVRALRTASAWSGPSRSTRRASTRSRSCATASLAGHSCTSCVTAWARRHPFGSAAASSSP